MAGGVQKEGRLLAIGAVDLPEHVFVFCVDGTVRKSRSPWICAVP